MQNIDGEGVRLLAVGCVCGRLFVARPGDTEKTYDYVSKVQVGEDSFVYFRFQGIPMLVHGTCATGLVPRLLDRLLTTVQRRS
jgi:hypothetical protein